MGKSRKGSQWERDVCKFLSKWITGSEKPYLFWRGRGSGSIFTLDSNVGEAFSGDIYAVREEGRFLTSKVSIECKNGYLETSFDNHIKQNKNENFKKFWIQTIEGCSNNREPLLIFKKKGMPVPWVCISNVMYKKLKSYLNGLRFVHINWPNEGLPDLYAFDMKKFFSEDHITSKIFQEEI